MNQTNDRRGFLKKGALLSLLGLGLGKMTNAFGNTAPASAATFLTDPVPGKFQLPALPYGYDALEPYIDKMTMEIHHTKHHQAYVDNLNKAVEATASAQGLSLENLCAGASKFPGVLRNNAGGHYNHSFFWNILMPDGGNAPKGKLADAINDAFGSFDAFKTKFAETATSRFGSGWAWLVSNKGKLSLGSTPNQDNPLMDLSEPKGTPVLALDVWEHAYYLKYQNKRADYIKGWWALVNWEQANKNYEASR